MPRTTGEASHTNKRKRVPNLHAPLKRPRSETEESDESIDIRAQILLLENEVLNSKKKYNNIVDLIGILNASDQNADIAAVSLCRVFTRLMVSGALSKKENDTEKEAIVLQWLQQRYVETKALLSKLISTDEFGTLPLTICMRLLKTEGEHLLRHQDFKFPTAFLTDIIRELLNTSDKYMRAEFSQTYLEEYDDIRFYTFEALAHIIQNDVSASGMKSFAKFNEAVEILSTVESIPESNDEIEDFYVDTSRRKSHALYFLKEHKKRAQRVWLEIMGLSMTKEQKKFILSIMTKAIVPWFTTPELLMDFLTDAYNTGGSTSLLALSGVFYLIREKNLDYSSFYTKLYSLLDADMLHSKHRSEFFRLLDTFLASTHLPAILVASFIKRLSRLALSAPPSAIVVIVPWMYNVFQKHPTCTFMIHRVPRGAEEKREIEEHGAEDPFNMEENDPMRTNAIESSIWEIEMLQSHYHPNVATLAKIISEQFTKHAYNMEDFLDHSYGSMLEAELSKQIKKPPVIEYEIPRRVFMEQDAGLGVGNGLLAQLWNFT